LIDRLVDLIPITNPLLHALLVLFVGLVFLLAGAELFVIAAVRLSVRLGLPRITIGLTLVAVGTSLPELGASFAAVVRDAEHGGALAIGNALGSNVSNIGLLLGLAALYRPVSTAFPLKGFNLAAMAVVAGLFAVIAYTRGSLQRPDAILGMVVFLLFIWFLFRGKVAAYPGTDELEEKQPHGTLVGDAALFLIGGAMVWFGSEVLVRGAISLAARLGVTAGVIGAALVSVGTSLPELAVCFSAARRKEGGILLGNLIGSNIANVLLVLGAVASYRPLVIGEDALVIYTPAVLIFTVLMVVMATTGRKVSRAEGSLLLLLYAAYQVIVWTR